MFLFDPAATPDWEACRVELDRLMERIGAKVIVANKWDERRLAYEIRGRKRGIYGLTFFEAEPDKLTELERDTNLSEAILRVLILKAEHLTEEEMKEVASRAVVTSEDEAPETPEATTKPSDLPEEEAPVENLVDSADKSGDDSEVAMVEPTEDTSGNTDTEE
jgi:ribosomal protein S6